MLLGQPDDAAAWLLTSAEAGIGSEPDAPLDARVHALLHGGFLDALAGQAPEGARELEEHLKTRLQQALA